MYENLPEYKVVKTTVAPALDGKIDPAVWDNADEMLLLHNETGEKPKRETRVRLLYDNESLYVSYLCDDPEIFSSFRNHDDPLYDENVVEIFIDPVGRLTSYVELEVSPRNVGFDALILNNSILENLKGRGDRFQAFVDYDPPSFRHAVTIDGELGEPGEKKGRRWKCELAIDFKDIFFGGRVTPVSGEQWRINIFRVNWEDGKLEESAFSPTLEEDFHIPGRFGRLVFC